jgi:hypothetical protein
LIALVGVADETGRRNDPALEVAACSRKLGVMKPYEEAAIAIAKAIDPKKLASLRASKATSRKVERLVQKHKDGEISRSEQDELDRYMMLNQIMSIVKAKARLAAMPA